MSFKKIQWALSVKIKPIPSRVLIQLASHHNEETGMCCPSISSLQQSCQLSRQGVVNNLKYLEERNLITRSIGQWGSNQYKLNTNQSSKWTSQEDRLVKEVDQGSQVNGLEIVKEVDQGSQVNGLKTVIKTGKETGKETKGVYCSKFEKIWDISRDSYKSTKSELGSKKKAHDEYKKLKPSDELIDLIIRSLVKQKDQKVRSARLNEFCPPFQHVERWIKNRRWEDEVMENTTQPSRRSRKPMES